MTMQLRNVWRTRHCPQHERQRHWTAEEINQRWKLGHEHDECCDDDTCSGCGERMREGKAVDVFVQDCEEQDEVALA